MKGRSERALILAPMGRDAVIAADMLAESHIKSSVCASIARLANELGKGVGFVLVTEEALLGQDLRGLSVWINSQPEWSDLPFVLLTRRGGPIGPGSSRLPVTPAGGRSHRRDRAWRSSRRARSR